MRLVGLAVAAVLVGAGGASAQYVPRPAVPVGPASAQDAAEIVQAMGLDPIGSAVRSGPFYVQNARDDFGRLLRVTVDARRSQVLAIEPAGATRAPYGRYAGYGPYRSYPGYGMGPYDDDDLTPPGSIIGARLPPHAATPPMPQAPLPPAAAPKPVKSATAAPVPRKRPAAAPQEPAGSVDPLPQQSAPARPAETAPPTNPMPPVAPLE